MNKPLKPSAREVVRRALNFGSFDVPYPPMRVNGVTNGWRTYKPQPHWAQARMDEYRAYPSLIK